jgi:hypothetical protein
LKSTRRKVRFSSRGRSRIDFTRRSYQLSAFGCPLSARVPAR